MDQSASFVAGAVRNWNGPVERATRFFEGLSDDQLQTQVAPNKNGLFYLWGHLTAVHDAMLPLLGIGPRLRADYDPLFVSAPDRSQQIELSKADLATSWTEVSQALREGFASMTPADWLKRHSSVSEEDFAREPHRNRFAILVSRSSHLSYHLGQAVLAKSK